jgi:hypothetical protein
MKNNPTAKQHNSEERARAASSNSSNKKAK